MKVGVVGVGVICSTHVDGLRGIDGIEVAGLHDVDGDALDRVSAKLKVPAFHDFEALLAAVDAVHLCVPSGLHADLGVVAAEAGTHVLVEKPIDVDVAAAERLVDTCRRRGVALTVVSQHRFAPGVRKARDLIESGGLGRLLQAHGTTVWYRTQDYYNSGAWRGTMALDGGCLMNQGVHYVDLLQWLAGGVKAVWGCCRTANHDIEAEDIGIAMLEFRNGAVGAFLGSTVAQPGFAETLEFFGDQGSVRIASDRIVSQHPPSPAAETEANSTATGATDPTAIWGYLHQVQFEDFYRAIAEKRDPAITGEAALEPVRIIRAIYQSSADNGRRVEL